VYSGSNPLWENFRKSRKKGILSEKSVIYLIEIASQEALMGLCAASDGAANRSSAY
jgi:hypothetical protein